MRVVLKILVMCLIWPSLFVQAQPVIPAPSNLPVQEKERRWEQASEAGKKAFGENRYDEAEDQFKQALALATEMKSAWRLGYSHDCLAEFYRLRERPKDARLHFEKAYENFSEALNYEDAALNKYLAEIEAFFVQQGWQEEWQDYLLEHIVKTIELKDAYHRQTEGFFLAMMLMAAGEDEASQKRKQKLEPVMQKLLALSEQEHQQSLTQLDPIEKQATEALRKNDHIGAEKIYRAAIRAAEKQKDQPEALAKRLEALATFLETPHYYAPPPQTVMLPQIVPPKPANPATVAKLKKTPTRKSDPQGDAAPPPPPPLPPPQRTQLPQVMPPTTPTIATAPDRRGQVGDVVPKPVTVVPKAVRVAKKETEARQTEINALRRRAIALRQLALEWNSQRLTKQLRTLSALIKKTVETDKVNRQRLLDLDLALWTKAKGAESYEVGAKMTEIAEVYKDASRDFRRPWYREIVDVTHEPREGLLTGKEKEAFSLFRERFHGMPYDDLDVLVTRKMKRAGVIDPYAEKARQLLEQALAHKEKLSGPDSEEVLQQYLKLEDFYVHQGLPQEVVQIQQRIAEWEAKPKKKQSRFGVTIVLDEKDGDDGQAKINQIITVRKNIRVFDMEEWKLTLWRPVKPTRPIAYGPWFEFDLQELFPTSVGQYDQLDIRWSDVEFRVNGERLLVGLPSRYGHHPLREGKFGEVNLAEGTVTILSIAEQSQLWATATPVARKPHQHQIKQEYKSDNNTTFLLQTGDMTGTATDETGQWQARFKITTNYQKVKNPTAILFGGNLVNDMAARESQLQVEIFHNEKSVETKIFPRTKEDWAAQLLWEPTHHSYRPMSWIKVGRRPVLLFEDTKMLRQQTEQSAGGTYVMYVGPTP